MTNHYHVQIETIEGNLSQGMRQLNGLYTQHYNRRHDLVGHLFQGRYKAILVQKERRRQFPERDHAMACAYSSTLYTMVEIDQFFGVSLRSVSRAVRKFEKDS